MPFTPQQYVDSTDLSKKIGFDSSGNTTAKTLTLASAVTNDRTITFPDASGTVSLSAGSALLTWSAERTATSVAVTGNGGVCLFLNDADGPITQYGSLGTGVLNSDGSITIGTTGVYLFLPSVCLYGTVPTSFTTTMTTGHGLILNNTTSVVSSFYEGTPNGNRTAGGLLIMSGAAILSCVSGDVIHPRVDVSTSASNSLNLGGLQGSVPVTNMSIIQIA